MNNDDHCDDNYDDHCDDYNYDDHCDDYNFFHLDNTLRIHKVKNVNATQHKN